MLIIYFYYIIVFLVNFVSALLKPSKLQFPAFRCNTLTRRTNHSTSYKFPQLFQAYDSSDDDDIAIERKKLLDAIKLLKKHDQEWLKTVVGDSLNPYLLGDGTEINGMTKSNDFIDINAEEQNDKLDINDQKDLSQVSNNEALESPEPYIEEMKHLGYSLEDIVSIKKQVRESIVEMRVVRPRKGLPDIWLIPNKNSASKRKLVTEPYDESKVSSKENGNRKMIRDDKSRENKDFNSKFKWHGGPVTENEKKRSKQINARIPIEPRNLDDIEPQNFWPDREEFKDMLLDESRFRVETIGDWVAPLVKAETKWRYNIYKSWLGFLDQGFGDTFDIEDEDFEDEDLDDIDDELDDLDASETYENSPRESSKYRNSEKVETNREEILARKRKEAKARAYEDYLRQKLESANENWSNIREEERIVKENMLPKRRPGQRSTSSTKRRRGKQITNFNKEAWFDDEEDEDFGYEDDENDYFDESSNEIEDDYLEKLRRNNKSSKQVMSKEEFDKAWEDSEKRNPIDLNPPIDFREYNNKRVASRNQMRRIRKDLEEQNSN